MAQAVDHPLRMRISGRRIRGDEGVDLLPLSQVTPQHRVDQALRAGTPDGGGGRNGRAHRCVVRSLHGRYLEEARKDEGTQPDLTGPQRAVEELIQHALEARMKAYHAIA